MSQLINMNSNRTFRLARRLLGSDGKVASFSTGRESAFYDVQERTKYTYSKRGLALKKYTNKLDIFGSFTMLPKLGINPSTDYDTPVGVYCYPIDYLVENYDESTAKFDVPFAGDAFYLHIFTVKDLDKALVFNPDNAVVIGAIKDPTKGFSVSDTLGKAIYEALYKARTYVMKNQIIRDRSGKIPQDWYQNFIAGLKSPEGAGIGQFHPDVQEAILAHFTLNDLVYYNINSPGDEGGIEGFRPGHVIDKIIYNISLNQAVEEIHFPYENRLRNLPDIKVLSEKEYQKHKKKALGSGQRLACDTAFIWNFLRLFANNRAKWTDLMRQMGFIGAVDYDTGTIHENEPTQAVFFNPSSLKVIEVMHNKIPQQHKGGEGGTQSMLGQWAEDTERGVLGALAFLNHEIETLNEIANLFSSRGYTVSLIADFYQGMKNIMRYIGWLNLHAKDHHEWSPLKKSQVESGVEQAMIERAKGTYEFRLRDTKDLYERIMRSLRRGR